MSVKYRTVCLLHKFPVPTADVGVWRYHFIQLSPTKNLTANLEDGSAFLKYV